MPTDTIGVFVLAFTVLLPVINPFSGAMFYSKLVRNLNDRDRAFVANRIALYCMIVLIVCTTCGQIILNLFGISVGVLQLAGGIVLFAMGWKVLNAPTQDESTDKQVALPRAKLNTMAFYPFTLPLTTGPGAIAAAVALTASASYTVEHFIGTTLAIFATVFIVWGCYRFSDRFSRAVGLAGSDAFIRIFAFIVICLGVSIGWQGFEVLWLNIKPTV